jgi:hypothetical protein
MKFIVTLALSLFGIMSYAQSKPFEEPANFPPSDKKEFGKFKDDFMNAVNWYENTPFNEQQDSHESAAAFIMKYLMDSPDVDAVLDGSVLKVAEKNPQMLTIYMGSYARLAFESPKGKQDHIKCSIAALKSVMKFYKANIDKGLKKDKNIVKLVEADEKNELEKWIKDNGGKH